MGFPRTFISRAFIKKGPPVHLIWFVTAKCNLRCSHCFYFKEIASAEQIDYSSEDIFKVIDNLPPLLSLALTGGEPTIRPDLYDIVKRLDHKKVSAIIRIFTNGHNTDRIITLVEKILRTCDHSRFIVSVSIDGDEDVHDKFREKQGAYANTVKTILRLKELKARYPRFDIGINSTLHAGNQRTLEGFRQDIHAKFGIYPGITVIRGTPKNPRLKDVDLSIYKKIIQDIEKDRLSAGRRDIYQTIVDTREAIGHEMAFETFASQKRTYECYAGTLLGVIYADGEVSPCEMLPGKNFGNLRDFDFDLKKVWENKDCGPIRDSIRNKECACTYECQYTCNTLYNKRYWPRFIKNIFTNLLLPRKK